MKELKVVFGSKKAQRNVEVDLMKLPEASLRAVAAYGARRFINDKLGGSEIDGEEAAKMFDEIMAQLEKGWEGRQAASSVDPVEAKARANAKAQVKAAIQAKGRKLNEFTKEQIGELADGLYEANKEAYTKAAKEQLEAEAKAKAKAAEAIDLSSLGL